VKVAFGMKAHSGWAALVVLGTGGGLRVQQVPQVIERYRMELVEEGDDYAKQPYHGAEQLGGEKGKALVRRAIVSAGRFAIRETRAAVKRTRDAGHEVAACAVLVSEPMPEWTVDEILAVHFRMHKAEGMLFREALASAAETCGLKLVRVLEKGLAAASMDEMRQTTSSLGKTIGPPWGKDQKDAALAALIALSGRAT